jgi:CheY-like chemotaxis protein
MIARAIPKTGPRRFRLLYVEDHAESMARVEQLLARRKDLLLVRAGSLHLALEQARVERPEVILINIDLPGPSELGAIGLMKLLRESPGTRAAPILALSANAAPAAIVKGLEAGFFHYLTQPLKGAPFTEALAYALEFAALERAEQL